MADTDIVTGRVLGIDSTVVFRVLPGGVWHGDDNDLVCLRFLAVIHHAGAAKCVCHPFCCLCNVLWINGINDALKAPLLDFFCQNDGDLFWAIRDFFYNSAGHRDIDEKRLSKWIRFEALNQISKADVLCGRFARRFSEKLSYMGKQITYLPPLSAKR